MDVGLFDKDDDQATLIEKTNAALQSAGVAAPEDEAAHFSEDDLNLAEKIFFQGYADKVFEHPTVKSFSVKITTLMPAEYDMIDSALMKFVDARREGDRSMVSDIIIATRRSNLTLALCLVEINGKEVLEGPEKRIKNIKSAVKKYEEYLTSGEIVNAQKTLSTVIGLISERANKISTSYNGNVIDWINERRRDLEELVSDVVTREGSIVKS